MTGLNAHVVYLYPKKVLSMGNGALYALHYLANHLFFLLHCFCNDLYKDSKTPNITQFGALAGQIQHMATQKVGFTPWLLRQVALTCRLQV